MHPSPPASGFSQSFKGQREVPSDGFVDNSFVICFVLCFSNLCSMHLSSFLFLTELSNVFLYYFVFL